MRHEREKLAPRWKMSKVGDRHRVFFADLACYLPQLLVRTFQELLKEPELMHQLERGRMNRIATKVAQKIGVLLKNRDLDARAREQKAEHHAGRPSAYDAAPGFNRCRHKL